MLNQKRFPVVVLLAVALFLSGCTMAKISGKGPIPLLLNNPSKKVEVIEHLKASKMITFDYTGSFDVYEIIAEKLANTKADAAINLTVTIKSDMGTFLVNLFTFGLANARTIQVEGDLVKAPEGVSSLFDPSQVLAKARDVQDLKSEIKEIERHGRISSIVRTDDGFAILGSK